jgi:hypothetical protein
MIGSDELRGFYPKLLIAVSSFGESLCWVILTVLAEAAV